MSNGYVVRYKVTKRLELQERLAKRRLDLSFIVEEENCSPKCWKMLESFNFATTEGTTRYIPCITTTFDYIPNKQELLKEIEKGNISLSYKAKDGTSIKEVVERFLSKKATFAELKTACKWPEA